MVGMAWRGVAPLLLLLVGSGACGPSIALPDEEGSGSTDEPTTSPGSVTLSTTLSTTSQTTISTTGGQDTATSAQTDGPGTAVTTTPPPPPLDVGPIDCAPLGLPCIDAFECCSGECFVQGPLGGVCSACTTDADCRFGCTAGSPLDGTPAECGDGDLGSGCQTSGACLPGLWCATIFEIPGILSAATCGECQADGDCGPGLQCAPLHEPGLMAGYWRCVAPGSLPIDAGCDGDAECASGHCAEASIMGIPVMFVCSECSDNGDCDFGLCQLPEVVIDGTELVLESGSCG